MRGTLELRGRLAFIRDMASELARLSEAEQLDVLKYLFRMAELEANEIEKGMSSQVKSLAAS